MLFWYRAEPMILDQVRQEKNFIGPSYRPMLSSCRVMMPLSYILIGAVGPIMPYRLGDLGVSLFWETPLTSIWLFVRVMAVALMWRLSTWHGRWGSLVIGGASMAVGFVLITVGPSTSTVVLGLALLGTGQGITYYSAIYYALALGDEADYELLLGLAHDNGGRAVRVYEDYGATTAQMAQFAQDSFGSVRLAGLRVGFDASGAAAVVASVALRRGERDARGLGRRAVSCACGCACGHAAAAVDAAEPAAPEPAAMETEPEAAEAEPSLSTQENSQDSLTDAAVGGHARHAWHAVSATAFDLIVQQPRFTTVQATYVNDSLVVCLALPPLWIWMGIRLLLLPCLYAYGGRCLGALFRFFYEGFERLMSRCGCNCARSRCRRIVGRRRHRLKHAVRRRRMHPVALAVVPDRDRRGHRDRRRVRTATAQRRHAAIVHHALETGDHRNLALRHRGAERAGVDVGDARARVRFLGADRQLPAKPAARVDIHGFQCHRQQAAGDLFTGSDHDIIFGRVVKGGRFLAEADQPVRLARHGGHDDGDFMALGHDMFDPRGHVANSLHPRHGGAAEFHHDARHLLVEPVL